MKRKGAFFGKAMTLSITLFLVMAAMPGLVLALRTEPLVIGHENTDLSQIPDAWITAAKTDLHIVYQHTSHGSQLITGMNALENFPAFDSKYNWEDDGSPTSALDLDDYGIPGCADLSEGDTIDENGVTPWVTATRNLLENPVNTHVNVVVWSWCSINGHDIPRYLTNMEVLISEYGEGGSSPRAADHPVEFVFMTGHAEGQGEGGFIHTANEQIRQHCNDNNRILFDFADIENYDPDGIYYYDNPMWDDLDYNPGRTNNWGTEWCSNNVGSELEELTTGNGVTGYNGCGSCAHSGAAAAGNTINCVLKGKAAWWLWAQLAGWSGNICTSSPSGLNAVADSVAEEISLNWLDHSSTPNESSFIVQRQVDGGTWNDLVILPEDTTSYTDTSLVVGTYGYRVMAHLDDSGDATPCNSAPSNVATAVIITADPPEAPTLHSPVVDSCQGQVLLTWTDNADNETGFYIQRSMDSGPWDDTYDTVGSNVAIYTDQDVAHGNYTYRIQAYNDFGQGTSISDGAIVDDMPMPPGSLSATGNSMAGTVTLVWTDNSDNETGFMIQRSVDGGPWNDIYDTVGSDVTTYLDDNRGGGPLPNGVYTYRVMADKDGADCGPSQEAGTIIASSAPAGPTNLDSSLSGFDITLTWNDNSDNEEVFIIERAMDGGFFVVLGGDLPAGTESHVDTSLQPLHTYAYRVKASNSFDDSDYSNETSEYVPQASYTITLESTSVVEDAFLSSISPDTNYGPTNYLSVFERLITKFNVPAEVFGKRIVNAHIAFYGWAHTPVEGDHFMDLYRITHCWTENEVTWNRADNSHVWSIPGGDYDTLLGRILFPEERCDHCYYDPIDMTYLVQEWADETMENYGVILVNDSVVSTGLKASEYGGNSTYLEITYTNKPVCPGDMDKDGDVDGTDMAFFSEAYSASSLDADLTNNGQVNDDDCSLFVDCMGRTDCL